MIGFKQYCFEGSKKIITKPEVDKMLDGVSHAATRSEWQRLRDLCNQWLWRLPTYADKIVEYFKPLISADPNFIEKKTFGWIGYVHEQPVLLEDQEFADWENRDWITRDRANVAKLRFIYQRMTSDELKKLEHPYRFAAYDQRYKDFAREELEFRKKHGFD